jgi:hypothetical protein
MNLRIISVVAIAASLLVHSPLAFAQASTDGEVDDIKQTLEELRLRVAELEADETARKRGQTDAADSDQPRSPGEEAEAAVRRGHKSPVIYRHAMNDRQAAAARAGDYTLDPDYRGFIPIPNTVGLIKFNARPRADFMGDTGNPGTDFRFVPSKFPASSDRGWQFSGNSNASQLRVEVRAPSLEGDFRFFYQNDFFGSNSSNMNYRLQHLYGEFHGVVGGFTFGVFEDPDAWPDTVDYEGPNSVIFSRRTVAQYKMSLADDWVITMALEDPDIYIDTTADPGNARQRSRAPDGGVALRWTPGDYGHVRASAILRSLSVDGDQLSDDDALGWGFNTSGSLRLTSNDTFQFWFVYGRGIAGMGNDTSFLNSDAAFDSSGDLKALEYYSTMVAVTHAWSPKWRSTATHGYVYLDNTHPQPGDTYHKSHYASLNLVYQVFKRARIGLEGLYGYKEVKDGRDNDIFRIQLGLSFSLFD